MDRFKFRAYITVSYEDDEDNEKEVSFYLYNIVNDEGDVIYINRDFLLDAIKDYDDETQEKIEEVLQDNSCTGDYENICIEQGFYKNLEQCTGLKDKNGKLIYEGDVVKDKNGHYGYVKWDNEELKYFVCKRLEPGPYWTPCSMVHSYEYEIVGNIHENKDLLENK